MARTAVSKKLNEWIRDNNLQKPEDRRIIIPNKELLGLFNDEYVEGCHLDFFTLQKYIKHHYPKDDPVEKK
jgi:chromatin remodeling complex protein RSC6